MGYRKAPHHKGQHQRLARIVTAQANNNPNYRCPTCGLTRDQGIQRWGTNGHWEAGHKNDGQVATAPTHYHAQHRHCNRSTGATQGNTQRTTGYTWP